MSTRIAKQQPVMRKKPRQARSRATVETILQAGARILSDEVWAGFTTNKVADLAGVSIGSLYQYFPDKLSLVDAIRRRHLDDCIAVMRQSKAEGLSPVQYYRNPNSEFEIEYLGYYAEAVAAYRNRQPSESDRTAALIISDAIDGVIHNAARRGMLGDPLVQSELIRLVSLYLEDRGEASVWTTSIRQKVTPEVSSKE